MHDDDDDDDDGSDQVGGHLDDETAGDHLPRRKINRELQGIPSLAFRTSARTVGRSSCSAAAMR